MRLLSEKLPEIPLVAAFETDFHRTIPDGNRYFAIPYEWAEKALVRRYGFHGASHRYIAERTAELLGPGLRIISCHLGGSSSLCAIRDGKSVATSMGFSAQSGLPQNNRVGDFDPFALPVIMKHTGKSLAEVLCDSGQPGRAAGASAASAAICATSTKPPRPATPGRSWPSTSIRPPCGTISARTWSNWAAPT